MLPLIQELIGMLLSLGLHTHPEFDISTDIRSPLSLTALQVILQ